MARLEYPVFVTPGNEQEWPVRGRHFIDEDGNVHGPRLRHTVIPVPRPEVLMPLPDVAVEGGFGVDLELMHVDRAIDELHDRLDQSRVPAQAPKRLVVHMRGESGACRTRGFPPDFFALKRVDLLARALQDGGLFEREVTREEQVALLVEIS